jgi:hypothetical protein
MVGAGAAEQPVEIIAAVYIVGAGAALEAVLAFVTVEAVVAKGRIGAGS